MTSTSSINITGFLESKTELIKRLFREEKITLDEMVILLSETQPAPVQPVPQQHPIYPQYPQYPDPFNIPLRTEPYPLRPGDVWYSSDAVKPYLSVSGTITYKSNITH